MTTTISIDALAKDLRSLANQERRAQLQALMPVIDELSRQGVSHESLAKRMATGGITITATALRQALSRWRKRQSQTTPNTRLPPSPRLSKVSPDQPLSAEILSRPLPTPINGGITSKADLAKLRKSESIDLNELAKRGRQQ